MRRVVRRVELWSVLKNSLIFNVILLGVALLSVALLWGLANTTGVVDDLEGFLRDSGFEDFRFAGDRMFRQVAFIGAIGALALTVFTVLATALVNLISELTGGIRMVVIEEIVDESVPTASAPLDRPALPDRPPVASPAPPTVPARPKVPSPFPDVDPPRPTMGQSSPPPRWPGSGPGGQPAPRRPETQGPGATTSSS